MGSTISFLRPDGQSLQGYLAEPAQPQGAPGIVVIQEWWGLNDQIRGVADRWAALGYRALVPDLYRGQSTVESAEAEHLMTGLNFGDAAGQDVRGAVQWLKAQGAVKVGVSGYCMGGALTLLASVFVPEVDAAVVFYGYPPLDFVDASKITAPLMGHWALQDAFFKIEGVDALEAKLAAAGVRFDFHRYDARHAFCNETQVGDGQLLPALGYAPQAAEQAWSRSTAFFGQHLR